MPAAIRRATSADAEETALGGQPCQFHLGGPLSLAMTDLGVIFTTPRTV
jgi:hypothetical protein